MKKLKTLILYLCSLLAVIQVHAQERTISGKVTSPEGIPIIGATVTVKNSSLSTAASAEGEFSLRAPVGNLTLVVSSIGFVTKEQVVEGNETNLVITLNGDNSQLGEVVVVGYGVQKKSDLTGSVSSIKGEDLTQLATHK